MIFRLFRCVFSLLVLFNFRANGHTYKVCKIAELLQGDAICIWIDGVIERELKVVSLIHIGDLRLLVCLLGVVLHTLSIFNEVRLSQSTISIAITGLTDSIGDMAHVFELSCHLEDSADGNFGSSLLLIAALPVFEVQIY